jgi:Mg-chelatase subunit ChlD
MNVHAYFVNDISVTADAVGKRDCWVRLVGNASAARTPLHLIACIDTSGSMEEEMRLENVRQTLRTVADFMGAEDKLSLVSFSEDSQILVRQAAMADAAAKAHIKHRVNGLQSGGGTNLSAGLINVLECLERDVAATRKQVLLLLTDGLINRGLTTTEQIQQLIRQALVAAPGLTVTTIGYGASHNVEMLRQAANAGGGTYSVVTSLEDVASTFGETFGTMVTTVAQAIKVPLSEGVEYVGAYTVRDGAVVVGDIGSGAEINLLLRVPVAAAAAVPLLTVNYYDCVDMNATGKTVSIAESGEAYIEDVRLYVLRQDVSAALLRYSRFVNLTENERTVTLAEIDGLIERCGTGSEGHLVEALKADLVACRQRIEERVGLTQLEQAQTVQNAAFFGLARGLRSHWSGGPALEATFSSPQARHVSRGVTQAVILPGFSVASSQDPADILDIV